MGRQEQFDELLKELKISDAYKETLRAGAKEDPAIMDAVLRQSDYDRWMNENKVKVEWADQWKPWADKNVPTYEAVRGVITKALPDVTSDQLAAKLEEALKSGLENNMTDAQLAEHIEKVLVAKGINPATASEATIKAAVEAAVKPAIADQAKALEESFLKTTFPSAMTFFSQVIDAKDQFREEFPGEKFDRDKYIGMCASGNFKTAEEAFTAFTAEARHKKELAETDRKAREDERTKLGNNNLPGTSTLTPTPTSGAVVEFMQRSRDAAAPAAGAPAATSPSHLSVREGAIAAAAELRGAGKV